MTRRTCVMESLECRTLLSATPSAVILADQQAVANAVANLADTRAACQTKLAGDRAAITNAWKQNPTQVASLRTTYRAALQAQRDAINVARVDLLATRAQWLTTYRADIQAVLAARGNPTALATAQATFAYDRIEYRRRITDGTAAVTTARLQGRSSIQAAYRNLYRAQVLGGSSVQNAKSNYRSDISSCNSSITVAARQVQFSQQRLAQDRALGL